MKKIIRSTLLFSFQLLVALLLTFGLHELILFQQNTPLNAHLIYGAYIINFLLVVVSYFVLLLVKQKNNQAVGFVFLGGFFLKLAIFMIFFNPTYKLDEVIERSEFAAFFVPYALCLAIETISLVRLLNRS